MNTPTPNPIKQKEKPPEIEGHHLVFCNSGYWHYVDNMWDGFGACVHLEEGYGGLGVPNVRIEDMSKFTYDVPDTEITDMSTINESEQPQ